MKKKQPSPPGRLRKLSVKRLKSSAVLPRPISWIRRHAVLSGVVCLLLAGGGLAYWRSNSHASTYLLYPPHMAGPNPLGYYYLPDSMDGAYRFESFTCPNQRWGKRETIGVIHTITKQWRERYPDGYFNMGDLNASGHSSHKWGVGFDFDASTNGSDWVGDYTKGNYNRNATIELGQMIIDTGLLRNLWFNDTTVQQALRNYAAQTGQPIHGSIGTVTNHENHMHVDLSVARGPESMPDCSSGYPQAPTDPDAGTGLKASYFAGTDLRDLRLERDDPGVDFTWGHGSPGDTVPDNHFSSRWVGQIKAPTSGTYNFTTNSDDGVRLWVDNRLIIDNWTLHAATNNHGSINLEAGRRYNIRLEHFEDTAAAQIRLLWEYPGSDREIIPATSLYPVTIPLEVTVSGRVTHGGQGIGGARVITCLPNPAEVTTSPDGGWSVTVPHGTPFCARVENTPALNGPATNNNAGVGGANQRSYEFQIAGVDCTVDCQGELRNWDRNTDSGYDFRFATFKNLGLIPGGLGYKMDSWGGLHGINMPEQATQGPSWNYDAAKRVVFNPNGKNGYVLDEAGVAHGFAVGNNPLPPALVGHVWPGQNRARDLVVYDWNNYRGYVLDMSGELHPRNGAPDAEETGKFESGDIARRVVVNAAGTGGYTMDLHGGLHPFSMGGNPRPLPTTNAYWGGWDIARAIVLNPQGTGGYTLDGYGGVHAFVIGDNLTPPNVTSPHWDNWDIARDFSIDWQNQKGYLLDGYGGVHELAVTNTQPSTKRGDADGNTIVDARDLSVVLRNYGQNGKSRAEGDLSGDGTVNARDLSEVLSHYGS